jgi:stage V sporulation protein B
LSTIIVKLLGLIYKIPLSAILGDEGMGYFNSAYTVYAFFYLLCTAGVPKAVMILVSEANARGGKIDDGRILKIASLMFLILGALITTIFICFSSVLSRLIGNSKAAATMVAIAPSIIFISLSGVIRGYLSAKTKLLDVAVSQIIEGVGKLVIGLSFAEVGRRLFLPLEIISALTILGVSIGAFFGLVYLFVCSRLVYEPSKEDNKRIKWSMVAKRLLSISIPITLSASVMSITNIIDLGLIMRSLTSIGYTENQANAMYGNYTTLAVPMLNLAISLITPISVAFLPSLTFAIIKQDNETLLNTETTSLDLTAFVSAPITLGLMTFPKEILDLLFKNSETEIGAALLLVLAPSVLFSSLLININTLLEALGRVNAPLISMIFGSLVKLMISNYLITETDLGILGAPIGTVVSYGVALIVSIIILSKDFKENIPFVSSYLPPFAIGYVSVTISRIFYEKIGGKTIMLIPSLLLCSLIYLTLSIFIWCLRNKKIIKLAELTKKLR